MRNKKITILSLACAIVVTAIPLIGCKNKEYTSEELLKNYLNYSVNDKYKVQYDLSEKMELKTGDIFVNYTLDGKLKGDIYKDKKNKCITTNYDVNYWTGLWGTEDTACYIGDAKFYLDKNNFLFGKNDKQENWTAFNKEEFLTFYDPLYKKPQECSPKEESDVTYDIKNLKKLIKDEKLEHEKNGDYNLTFKINTKDVLDDIYADNEDYKEIIEYVNKALDSDEEIVKEVGQEVKKFFDANAEFELKFNKDGEPKEVSVVYSCECKIETIKLLKTLENWANEKGNFIEKESTIDDSTDYGNVLYSNEFSLTLKYDELEDEVKMPKEISLENIKNSEDWKTNNNEAESQSLNDYIEFITLFLI